MAKQPAFQEFNDRKGTFVRGDLSISAYDYRGTILALPFQAQLIETNFSGIQDAFGVKYNRACKGILMGGGSEKLEFLLSVSNLR